MPYPKPKTKQQNPTTYDRGGVTYSEGKRMTYGQGDMKKTNGYGFGKKKKDLSNRNMNYGSGY